MFFGRSREREVVIRLLGRNHLQAGVLRGLMALVLLLLPGTGATLLAVQPLPVVWVDAASGYAIGGFDPVNYFVENRALQPSSGAVEAWGGQVNWKFRNSGNRAAFLAHPEIYAPRFGGLDPFLLIKGRAVRGDPTLFDVFQQRLYLFYSKADLLRWRKDRAAFVLLARQNWPRAAHMLGFDERAGDKDAL